MITSYSFPLPRVFYSADDCFRLGAVAYFNQDYYHTVMWITEALNVWQTEQQKTIDKPTLLDHLSYSLYMVSQCYYYVVVYCYKQMYRTVIVKRLVICLLASALLQVPEQLVSSSDLDTRPLAVNRDRPHTCPVLHGTSTGGETRPASYWSCVERLTRELKCRRQSCTFLSESLLFSTSNCIDVRRVTCVCIDISLSRYTPRSRTDSTAAIEAD